MESEKDRTCDYCQKDFTISRTGSGGSNRRLCYDCLPTNLPKEERRSQRAALLRKKNFEYKISLGCQRCGYNKLAAALEWHHTDDDKLFDPSLALSKSWEAYLLESSKCTLLCANCHREVHAGL